MTVEQRLEGSEGISCVTLAAGTSLNGSMLRFCQRLTEAVETEGHTGVGTVQLHHGGPVGLCRRASLQTSVKTGSSLSAMESYWEFYSS